MGFIGNLVDGFKKVGKQFDKAGDSCAKGNYMEGFAQGLKGSWKAIANTVSFGGYNAIDKAAEKAVKEDGDDANFLAKWWTKDTKADEDLEKAIADAEKNGDKETVKKLSGSYLASSGLDFATNVGSLLFAPAKAVGAAAKGVGVASKAAGLAAKETAKAAAKETAKETAKAAAKETAKETAKAAAKETAKETAKAAAKETAKAAAKETAKETAKAAAKETAKETAKAAAKETAKGTTKSAIKKAGKIAVGTGATRALGPNSSQTAEIVATFDQDGAAAGVAKTVGVIGENVAGNGKNVVKDITNGAGTLLSSFLQEHPWIAKKYDTINAAAHATLSRFSNFTPVAYVGAACKKIGDDIQSLFTKSKKYNGVSLTEIKNDIQKDAGKNGNSWGSVYVKTVAKLDKQNNVDSSTRAFYGKEAAALQNDANALKNIETATNDYTKSKTKKNDQDAAQHKQQLIQQISAQSDNTQADQDNQYCMA